MKTQIVALSRIQLNSANPRTITDAKFQKLVNSLLALPKMLDIRPIVVDRTMTALGGNMRHRALTAIAGMDEQELKSKILNAPDVRKKSDAEQVALVEYWMKWHDKPEVEVIDASNLTNAEQQEFIIKDNASFGEWDYDALANQWDAADLNNWGVDSWDAESIGEDDEADAEAGEDNPYTAKIEPVTYEPRGEKPPITECYDMSKTTSLIERINKASIPEDIKQFLVAAAGRHTVFNYERIADFYAHSDKDIQGLFEDSALVIIDFDKAIEDGYVALTDNFRKQFFDEHGSAADMFDEEDNS